MRSDGSRRAPPVYPIVFCGGDTCLAQPTIREKTKAYRFADYTEQVVNLLARVVTVSVKTVEITDEMQALKRS